jgi:hypothetical protein
MNKSIEQSEMIKIYLEILENKINPPVKKPREIIEPETKVNDEISKYNNSFDNENIETTKTL